MKYIRVRAQHLGTGRWMADVPLTNETSFPIYASSRAKLELAVYRAIEESEGWNSFSVIWLDD